MRELRDSDLIKWNDRMKKSPYQVKINNSWTNGGLVISFYARESASGSYFPNAIHINNIGSPSGDSPQYVKACGDPTVNWLFSFSVVESRKSEFIKILSRLLSKGIENHVDVYGDGKKHEKVNITSEILTSSDETTHEIYNRTYVKYTYKFNGRLSSIMSYITIVEDAIEFFSNTWGYDEKGEEHCLVKYPIGTVVSKVKDKSSDFLVLDYNYVVDYKEYIINYVISEMFTDEKSMIIKYGDSETVREDDLCYSRNDRIDNILN